MHVLSKCEQNVNPELLYVLDIKLARCVCFYLNALLIVGGRRG